jgi:hypothetical protein
MPGSQEILVGLARQMYDDIRFITEHNPTQVVDDDTARVFNTLLLEVQQTFRSTPMVFAFNEMSARTLKYKDALVVMGQLYRLLRLMTQDARAAAAAAAPGPAQRASKVAPRPPSEALDPSLDEGEYDQPAEPPASARDQAIKSQLESDSELYGDGPLPPKVNPDGTIPFSLLDDDHGSQF